MTTIYRIKDFETDWTSKWNEDKDAVIKQLDDYVDSYLGEVVLGSFVVIKALVLEDIMQELRKLISGVKMKMDLQF